VELERLRLATTVIRVSLIFVAGPQCIQLARTQALLCYQM
jgi:hypothetical protein